MAREKKKKKEIVLTKENLLIQPVALTLRGVNPTVIGNRVTIAVVKRLREAFKEVITKHKTGEEWTQLSIFATDEVKSKYLGDNKLTFDIHMNEIVDDPRHYQDAFNAVCKIADVMVWAPITDEQGNVTMARTPLFTLLAKSNMEKSFNEKTGEVVYRYSKNTKPIIGLVMEKVVADYIFSFQKGYSDFLDYPALQANDKYYYPIYAFLSHYKKNNPSEVTIDYAEFRKMLGFEDIKTDDGIKYIGYDVFSQFNKRVLRPVMEEMKENAESNISDIWFDFEKIYHNGRASNPDMLKFFIYLSELGKQIMSDKTSTKEVMEIEKRLKDEFKQNPKQIRSIMKDLPVNRHADLVRKMNELSYAKSAGKLKIETDECAYWNVAFCNFIERVKTECKIEEEVKRKDSMQENVDMEEPVTVGDEDMEKWGRVEKALQESVSESDYHTWFSAGVLRIVSSDESSVVCEAPNKAYIEIVGAKFGMLLDKLVKAEWGEDVELVYKLK